MMRVYLCVLALLCVSVRSQNVQNTVTARVFGNGIEGVVTITSINQTHSSIDYNVTGFAAGWMGAMHVHTYGDLRDSAGAFNGGHFNPNMKQHGCYPQQLRHTGDMIASITADSTGRIEGTKVRDLLQFTGDASIVGRSIIIHEAIDDCGENNGNAGARIAQGVLGIANNPNNGAESADMSYMLQAILHDTQSRNKNFSVGMYYDVNTGYLMVAGNATGLAANTKYGFHIHEFGDWSETDGTGAASHYDPSWGGVDHGLVDDMGMMINGSTSKHQGDMGNLMTDMYGNAAFLKYVEVQENVTFSNFVGRGLILHADEDDGGQPTGNAGPRMYMGVIGLGNPDQFDYELFFDACADEPCENGACVNVETSFSCNCAGTIYIGDLCEEVEYPTAAIARLFPTEDYMTSGTVTFTMLNDTHTMVNWDLEGVPDNAALHIHEYGDITCTDGTCTGGHYNPTGADHGCYPDTRHQGDIIADLGQTNNGVTKGSVVRDLIYFYDMYSIIGRGVTVHNNTDDCTGSSGMAGPRVAVGVVGSLMTDENNMAAGGQDEMDGLVAVLYGTNNDDSYADITGVVYLLKYTEGDAFDGKALISVDGLVNGATDLQYGFHIHEWGDLTELDGTSAGGHFNPSGNGHALVDDTGLVGENEDGATSEWHQGDLGNIHGDDVLFENEKDFLLQSGQSFSTLVGKAIVIHALPDDGGQPTGNAGSRMAIGVIGIANPDLFPYDDFPEPTPEPEPEPTTYTAYFSGYSGYSSYTPKVSAATDVAPVGTVFAVTIVLALTYFM